MQVEVTVDKRLAITGAGDVVMLLRDKNSNSAIPIFIGQLEAAAIVMELEGIVPPRPLTADLLKNIMVGQCGAMITKAVITEPKDNVYYALLHIERGAEQSTEDCRPSDAIALALRFGVPIFVEENLWIEMLESENTKGILSIFEKLMKNEE